MFKRLFTVMAVVAFCTAVPAALAATAANVNPRQAAALLKERADIYLLDVRTLQEYRQAHLADSNLIPIDQIERRLAEIPRNRPILVYCAVGSRSAQVFSYLARRGYPEVYNLDGGIVAWAQHGYPVSR